MKNNNFRIQWLVYLLTTGICLLEIISYPKMWQIKIGIDLTAITFIGILLITFLSWKKLSEPLNKTNRMAIGPVLFFFFVPPLVESFTYDNFIFSKFHFNYWAFQPFMLFVLTVFFVGNKKLKLSINNLNKKIKNKINEHLLYWKKSWQYNKKRFGKTILINFFNFFKKNLIFIIIFVIFYFISLMSPDTGDIFITKIQIKEQGNIFLYLVKYLVGSATLGSRWILENVFESLMIYGGEFFYNLILPILFVLLAILLFNLLKNKKPLSILLFFSLTLFVSNEIFGSVYLYANTAYIMPIITILAFLFIYKKWLINKNSFFLWLAIICAFFSGNGGEHIGIGFVTSLGVWWLYEFWKNKTQNKELLYSLISAIIGFYLGTIYLFTIAPRGDIIAVNFIQKTNYFESLYQNLLSLTNLVVIKNIIIFFITNIVIFLAIFKKKIVIKLKKMKVLYLFFLVILTGLFFLIMFCPSFINIKLDWLNVLFIIYLLSFFIPFFYFENKSCLFLYSIGLSAILALIVTSQVFDRTVFVLVIMIIISTTIIFSYINWNKKYLTFFSILIFLLLFWKLNIILPIFWQTGKIQNEKELLIKQAVGNQLNNNYDYKQLLVLPKLENGYIFGGNDLPGQYHYQFFLKYYNLNNKTIIKYK